MRSIFRISKRLIAINIAISVILSVIVSIFIVSFLEYKTIIQDSTLIFRKLNEVFTQNVFDEKAYPLLEKYVQGESLAQLKAGGSVPGFQDAARDLSRAMQDLRNTTIEKLFSELRMQFVFYLFAQLIFIVSLYRFYRYISIVLRASNNLIQQHDTLSLFTDGKTKAGEPSVKTVESEKQYQELHNLVGVFKSSMQIQDIFRKIINLDMNTSLEQFIDDCGKIICSDDVQALLPCDRFSLAVVNHQHKTVVAYHAYTRDSAAVFLKAGFTQQLAETSLLDIVEQGQPFRIFGDLGGQKTTETIDLLLEEGIRSNLTVPLLINDRLFGFIFFASRSIGAYSGEHGRFAKALCNLVGQRVFYSHAIQRNLSAFSESIINVVEFKDDETADHTRRVSLYAEILAMRLAAQGLIRPEKVREITDYASLHDIGKVGIPDAILLKPGKLSAEEWAIMKEHSSIGAKLILKTNQQIISDIGYGLMQTAYNLIIDHHEKWDGSGYPAGKRAGEISIEGQLVAIADVFDALTTKRSYKEVIPFDQSVEIMKDLSHKQFNPELIDIFIDCIDEIRAVYIANYSQAVTV